MSERAEIERSERKYWARAGSRHDRLIATLRVILPAAIGALAASMVFTPLVSSNEFSFVLDKNKVAIAKDRIRVTNALYRGEDNQGRPFTLSAENAVQRSATDPVLRIDDMIAQIALQNGPAELTADHAEYNLENDMVSVDGPIAFTSDDGYTLQTRGVSVDLKNRTLSGDDGVSGTMPLGRFSANRMTADLESRRVSLIGSARLRINQGVLR